jgi:hypothetical protein
MSVIWSWTYFYNLHRNNYLYFKGLPYIWEEMIIMALLHMTGLENSECIWKIQRKPIWPETSFGPKISWPGDLLLGDLADFISFIWLLGYLVEIPQWEHGRDRLLGVLHNNLEPIRKQQTFVRNVIIEGAPHENKMAGKGQITSERGRKW